MTEPLPTTPAHLLVERPRESRWLVDRIWSDPAVGVIGGEPKCGKTFLALDLAVAVAGGRPCLGHFAVHHTGPVVLYAAEDDPASVRRRLDGLAHHAGVDLEKLPIHVITARVLRIDLRDDQDRLAATLDRLRPRLLVLDPFVRLHRIDENVSGEVAPVLAHLRELQRRFGTNVVLVHHAKKNGHHLRAGQALRGSSELHAWGDSNLYLRRKADRIVLTAEHRHEPPLDETHLDLVESDGATALRLRTEPESPSDSPRSRAKDVVAESLERSQEPLRAREIRRRCRLRTERVQEALRELEAEGRVDRTADGYRIRRAFPVSPP